MKRVIVLILIIGLASANAHAELVSYWAFDEGEGTIAYDSANGNNGTVNGATWTTGKFGGALDFDGLNNYVDCGFSSSFKMLGDASICAWINLRQTVKHSCSIVVTEGGSGETAEDNAAFYSHVRRSGRLGYIHERGIGLNETYDFSVVPENIWIHIALVRDTAAKTVKAYFDGEYIGVYNYNYQPTNPLSELHLTIGSRSSGGGTFDGLIDDVRIYNHALSPAEIQEVIPEPATVFLLGLGGLLIRKKR